MATINETFKKGQTFTYTIESIPSLTTDNWSIYSVSTTQEGVVVSKIDNYNFTVTCNERQNQSCTISLVIAFQDNNTPNYVEYRNISIQWNGTYEPDKFIIVNTGSSDITIQVVKGSIVNLDFYYRVGATESGSYTHATDTTSITIPANQKVFMYSNVMTTWGASYSGDGAHFSITSPNNTVSFSGDISALLKDNIMTSSAFAYLFANCDITTAPELPATTLTSYCYRGMFQECSLLTTAPSLPATTLQTYCYSKMFDHCENLITPPSLPATTLAERCYDSMFYSCKKLTSAPALPATTLADACYKEMFYGCKKLASAPALPATTLTPNCYDTMFYGCEELSSAPSLPATNLAVSCYEDMFGTCTSITTAPTLPATTLAASCYDGMFYGCEGLTTAPTLPANVLATSCYKGMFEKCYNLTTAPTLSATTLVSNCYREMFNKCYSLNYITCLATSISASNCLTGWVNNVAGSGTFVKANDVTWPTGDNGIPNGWTVVYATNQ